MKVQTPLAGKGHMPNVSPIPLSGLGRLTGRFHLGESHLLVAMRCYFDGSEGQDDSGDQWLTLAGYMANDRFWADFQAVWEQMLRSRYPIAPYIHMWELLNGDDPFERVAGWTGDKINQLVIDAIDVLQGLDKSSFCSFASSINVSAKHRLVRDGIDVPDPIIICTETCVGAAFTWYFDRHFDKPELSYLFFDQGEPFIGHIRDKWEEHVNPKRPVVINPFWGLISGIQAVNMRINPPIQAADMIAWAITRSLSGKPRQYKHLADILIGNRERSGVVPSGRFLLDDEALREKYAAKNGASLS